MADIRIETENELFSLISKSAIYHDFQTKQLKGKSEREIRAQQLLLQFRGKYTVEILNQIFDTIDYFEGKKRWFGSLLAKPNRNLIFETEINVINTWLEELLFSPNPLETRLNICLAKNRVKGASKGLATLFIYIIDPDKYSIWVNSTQEGLSVLNRIGELKGNNWGENYVKYNRTVLKLKQLYSLQPQEMDWILTFIASYVEMLDDHFQIDEEIFKGREIPVQVLDEDELEDVVGKPMELRVMRWSPTNEMGVVALFIEFRKELGFPLIEIIRMNYPDAVVFQESSKGHIRRYVEFEYRSSGFKSHLKSKRRCHYVVCWEHDWKDCPIPVIELQKEIPTILHKK